MSRSSRWIWLLTILAAGTLLVAAAGALGADPNDIEGSSDPALVSRMPGYHIDDYDDRDFDSADMPMPPDGTTKAVEGHCTRLLYRINDGAKRASEVQIKRNYGNAIAKIGGKVLYEDTVFETMKLVKNGAEVWVLIEVRDQGDWYRLTIVQIEAMEQNVVADAASLANSLKETGKAAIYGIYFDSGKAEVKAESEPSLVEIGKLMKNSPKLKLYIVGHTDNVGGLDYNMKLSKDRADAVLKALASKYGVAASRLLAYGVGPLAPVSTNETEEGRALNRRVELVAQ